uniref:Uncharacterized protein n=1 Tax=Caenorhabditis japonica TaxID=281687 RepID=A0A8R1IKB3_CAEJA
MRPLKNHCEDYDDVLSGNEMATRFLLGDPMGSPNQMNYNRRLKIRGAVFFSVVTYSATTDRQSQVSSEKFKPEQKGKVIRAMPTHPLER